MDDIVAAAAAADVGENEKAMISWKSQRGNQFGLGWGEFFVPDDDDDGQYYHYYDNFGDDQFYYHYYDDDDDDDARNNGDDDDEGNDDDDISEAVEDEEGIIVWIEEESLIRAPVPPEISYNDSSSTEATALDEMASFICLPDIVLEQIFEYASSSPSDVIPIERVCKKFHRILRADGVDGNFWDRHILFGRHRNINFSYDQMTTREKSFVIQGLDLVSKYQEDADNPILSILHQDCAEDEDEDEDDEEEDDDPKMQLVASQLDELSIAEDMDLDGSLARSTEDLQSDESEMSLEEESTLGVADMFRSIAYKMIFKMAHGGGIGNPFRLRGDTVGYLAEMLLGRMTDKLENAILMATSRDTDTYPEVTKEDINFLDKIHLPYTTNGSHIPRCCVGMEEHGDLCHGASSSCFFHSSSSFSSSTDIVWRWPEDNCLDDDILSSDARRRIIRRIAYRAGIVKMTSEAFTVAEAELFHQMGILLVEAYESSMSAPPTLFRVFEDGDVEISDTEIFSIPPPLLHENGGLDHVVTIVPGQIKNAAMRRNHLPCLVIGDTWVASQGFTAETERKIEKSYYYHINPRVNEDVEDEDEDDYISEDWNEDYVYNVDDDYIPEDEHQDDEFLMGGYFDVHFDDY